MTPATTGLSEVYLRLASIVQRPEAFGLGASAPQPLTDTLEAMMQTLGQVIDEKEQPIPEDRSGEGTVAGCGSACGLLDMRVHAARKPTAQIRPFELQRGLVTGKETTLSEGREHLHSEGETNQQGLRTQGAQASFLLAPAALRIVQAAIRVRDEKQAKTNLSTHLFVGANMKRSTHPSMLLLFLFGLVGAPAFRSVLKRN